MKKEGQNLYKKKESGFDSYCRENMAITKIKTHPQ